jgi:hypothetical protein
MKRNDLGGDEAGPRKRQAGGQAGRRAFFLVSCDIGPAKPEPGIFRHASQFFGSEPAGG